MLNHIPSKSIPKAPKELWSGRKPTLNHFRICGCPVHVLKGKMNKLETRSEVYYFISYTKGTYGWYFYDPTEQKVCVSTNDVFLEGDYLMNHKPKGRIDMSEMEGEPLNPPVVEDNVR